jgi:hypothetical protein
MSTIKETIIDLFELDKMAPEKAAEMTERLSSMVFKATLLRVLPTLSEEDMDTYEKIIDSNESGQTLFTFLETKVPNFENIISEEAELLRQELAGEFKSAGL